MGRAAARSARLEVDGAAVGRVGSPRSTRRTTCPTSSSSLRPIASSAGATGSSAAWRPSRPRRRRRGRLALRPFAAVLHVGLARGRGIASGTLVVGTEAVCDLRRVAADQARRGGRPPRRRRPGGSSGVDRTPDPHVRRGRRRRRDAVSEGPLVEGMEGFGVLRAAALAAVPAVEVQGDLERELDEHDPSSALGHPAGPGGARGAIPAVLAALERVIGLTSGSLGIGRTLRGVYGSRVDVRATRRSVSRSRRRCLPSRARWGGSLRRRSSSTWTTSRLRSLGLPRSLSPTS